MSNRARALMYWTAITLTLLAAASLVITAIHPDFNPVVTIALVAGAIVAWNSHRRAVDHEQFDVLRREMDTRYAEFVSSMEELMDQWSGQVDMQVEAAKDVARMMLAERYPSAAAVGAPESTSPDRPRLTAVK